MNADGSRRIMYENLEGYSKVLSQLLAYEVRMTEDGLIMSGPLSVPTMNVALCRDAEGITRMVRMAEEHFLPRGMKYTIWTFAEVGTEGMMASNGYSRIAGLPGMIKKGRASEALVEGLELRRVDDRDGLMDFASVAFEAYEFPKEDEELFMNAFKNVPLSVLDEADVLVGYLNDSPVSTAIAFTCGVSTGVYFVSTLAKARGRGIGAAITARCVNLGSDRGAECSVLQSSDEGFNIYARAGFETFCSVELYARGAQQVDDQNR